MFGVLAGGVGGWAVLGTDNQVGSAVLVIVGSAFLLVGIQGTPLIKIGAGSNSVELERRHRRAQQLIDRARGRGNPDVAAGMVEAASIIEPSLLGSRRFRAELYVSKLAVAIQAVGLIVSRPEVDAGPDLIVGWTSEGVGQGYRNGGRANVIVKYVESGTMPSRSIVDAVSRASNLVGTLIVTNGRIRPEFEEGVKMSGESVNVVRWRDERDTPALASALQALRPSRST